MRLRGIAIDGVRLTATQMRAIYRDVHATVRRGHRARWYLFVVMVFLVLAPFAGLAGVMTPRLSGLGASIGASPMASAMAIGGLSGVFMAVVCRMATKYGFAVLFRRETREAMRRLGYALCPNCGYWLKGIESSPKCPECGDSIPGEERP